MGKKKTRVNFLINDEQWQEFKKLCEQKGTTPSVAIRGFILRFIRREKKKEEKGE